MLWAELGLTIAVVRSAFEIRARGSTRSGDEQICHAMFPRDDPGDAVVLRALTIARDQGQRCRPVDLLAALAEVDGPIAESLRAPGGRPLFPEAAAKPGMRGGSNGYLAAQAMSAAKRLAEERGEPMRPAHLLVAVLDQGDAEVTRALENANIRTTDARSSAQQVLGADSDLAPLTMPRITPAGTWDRPPIDISELDQDAWESLCWRQERLPLNRVRHKWHWSALSSLERGAAWRVANRYQVDDDQRYSLLSHHHDRVEALAHQAHPELVETRQQLRERHQSGPYMRVVSRRQRVWARGVPSFMVGWPTWFSNRRVGLRDKYFCLVTLPNYRGQPRPTR
jgi:Clp amino terminal domain, pathogenicity island component